MLLDLGTHLVDQALVLFGPAAGGPAATSHHRRGGPADDDVFVEIEHESGVASHLWASTVSPAPGPRMRVLGSEAGFVVENLDPQEDALKKGAARRGKTGACRRNRSWGSLVVDERATPVEPQPGNWPAFYELCGGDPARGRSGPRRSPGCR